MYLSISRLDRAVRSGGASSRRQGSRADPLMIIVGGFQEAPAGGPENPSLKRCEQKLTTADTRPVATSEICLLLRCDER